MKVYTAITGDYDQLVEQPACLAGPRVKFCAFLDRRRASQTWNIQSATTNHPTPRLNAKFHKVFPHLSLPDCKISLWIDGSVKISPQADLLDLAARFLYDADLAVFEHGQRYCVYQEAVYCLHKRLDDPVAIHRQVARYTQEGYLAGRGLAECPVLLRRHTTKLIAFSEMWWQEIQNGSIRDQISFPYVAWKCGLRVNYFPGTIHNTPWFRRGEHLGSRIFQAPPSAGKTT